MLQRIWVKIRYVERKFGMVEERESFAGSFSILSFYLLLFSFEVQFHFYVFFSNTGIVCIRCKFAIEEDILSVLNGRVCD